MPIEKKPQKGIATDEVEMATRRRIPTYLAVKHAIYLTQEIYKEYPEAEIIDVNYNTVSNNKAEIEIKFREK